MKYSQLNNFKIKGFSLIELMVAMVISLIVLLGLVSLFTNSSILNKAQTGLATLQENGRYAITRLKEDIQQAGRQHCASVSMPTDVVTNWNQGYAMSTWSIDTGVNLSNSPSTNGLPLIGQVDVDLLSDADQLKDSFPLTSLSSYPLDSRYFIQGHECATGSCSPDLTGVGVDKSTAFRSIGTGDGNRAANTDILTVRYLDGGSRIISGDSTSGVFQLDQAPATTGSNPTLISDCNTAYVANGNWAGTNLNITGSNVPEFRFVDARAFDLNNDFKSVSYFIGIDADPNRAGRFISSLYRSENGNVQQLVEGVERFDVFYLAQTQTGHVARLTADQVQAVSDGGDQNGDGAVENEQGCIIPPKTEALPSGVQLANSPGCLWRSIYALEIHLLLNTVNDSSMSENEPFVYSVDNDDPQSPGTSLPSGLSPDRMYRREFTATVPIRSYTL